MNIGQIGVPVSNLARARDFYTNTLSLPLLFETDTMAFLRCGDLRLMLTLPEKEAFAHASSVLYFHIESIHDAYTRLTKQGVSFVDEPHIVAKIGDTATWMTFFQDTEGNTLALMSEEGWNESDE
ncbi:VOC family protein [Shouchella lonarensis]|uniref:VOC domain-containing protein n=1 Tax=Shouchella lonarensis TaxID=1464122 RepID=A0A1G6LYD2_9BACI|nr:VOC family protein [Shouchella lonarensis]SDC47745.1 hypothetical protein SAMN05421737_10929 [Shouchella lonarensis]